MGILLLVLLAFLLRRRRRRDEEDAPAAETVAAAPVAAPAPVEAAPVAAVASPAPAAASGAVNLNTASEAELLTLPGIGPKAAARIIEHRDEYGSFAGVDGLLEVEGFTQKRIDGLRDRLDRQRGKAVTIRTSPRRSRVTSAGTVPPSSPVPKDRPRMGVTAPTRRS